MKKFVVALTMIGSMIGLAVGLMTSRAVAQNYVGLSVGFMSYSDTGADIDSQGLTIMAAGQIDPVIAVEFSYTSLLNAEVNGQDTDASVLALSGILRSPGEGFEPFLRLGLARGDADISGGDADYDETDTGLIYGLGGDILMNYNTSIRIEYVQTDINGAETDRLSIGSIYRF